MNDLKKTAKSSGIILSILVLLVSAPYQSALAAMAGTEKILLAGQDRESRDFSDQSATREAIRDALIAQGVDPQEAHMRVRSLTADEVRLVADKIDQLAAGGGVVTFAMIILAVIVVAVLVFNFTSVTDVFP